jgi:hypothetical protein
MTSQKQLTKREDGKMKKIIIILSIVFTLFLAGVLYGTQDRSDERETVSIKEAYSAQYPDQMPYVIMNPMVGFPLY